MALKVQGPGKKSKGRQSDNTKGKCKKCSKKGHYENDCWAKGGGKEDQAPAWFKPKNANSTKQSEETEFAFITNNDIVSAAILASEWLADSAVTTHIAWNKNAFMNYMEEPSTIEEITLGAVLQTHSWGTVAVKFKVKNKIKNKIYTTTLQDEKYAPDAPNNLISIGHLTDTLLIIATQHYLQQPVSNSNLGPELFSVKAKKWCMYQMRVQTKTTGQAKDFAATAKGCSWDKWHWILGHVNIWTIKNLLKNNLVAGFIIDKTQEQHNAWLVFKGSNM